MATTLIVINYSPYFVCFLLNTLLLSAKEKFVRGGGGGVSCDGGAGSNYIFAFNGTASTMICRAILRHSSAELICLHGYASPYCVRKSQYFR